MGGEWVVLGAWGIGSVGDSGGGDGDDTNNVR